MLGVEDERWVDVRERRRLVRLEDVAVERALEQVVVDAEEHVALGVAGRQQRSRDDLAGVAGLEDLELEAALVLERLLHGRRDRERVVRDEDDLRRLARRFLRSPRARARAAKTRPTQCLVTSRHVGRLPGG